MATTTILIDLEKLSLVQTLQETVDIERVDLDTDPMGEVFARVATGETMVILPSSAIGDTTVRSTGQMLVSGEFMGLLVTANDDLEEGDVVERREPGKRPERLYIEEIARIENVQWVGLATTRG